VNSDGKLEVIAAVYDRHPWPYYPQLDCFGITIYCYPESGKSSPLWNYYAINPHVPAYDLNGGKGVPSSISVGDVDGDGFLEVVFTVWFCFGGQTELFVLDAAPGAPTRLKYHTLIPFVSWSSVALADLDADKLPACQMVVTSSDGNQQQTAVLEVDVPSKQLVAFKPAGKPGWPQPVGSANIDPVVADVDGDGSYEILVGRHLWKANGTAMTGWPCVDADKSWTGAFMPQCGVDAWDIVLGGGTHTIAWMVGTGGSLKDTMTDSGEYLVVLGANENFTQGVPIVADITGTGCADVIRPAAYGSPLISKLYATSSLLFPRRVVNPEYKLNSSALVDDVDGDGLTDVLIAADGKIYFWNLGTPWDKCNPKSRPWTMFQHDPAHTGKLPKGPPLQITSLPNGKVLFSWHDYLYTVQTAPSVRGPWTDVQGASPMLLSPADGARFFRIKDCN